MSINTSIYDIYQIRKMKESTRLTAVNDTENKHHF
jgi:hypothetical protein